MGARECHARDILIFIFVFVLRRTEVGVIPRGGGECNVPIFDT